MYVDVSYHKDFCSIYNPRQNVTIKPTNYIFTDKHSKLLINLTLKADSKMLRASNKMKLPQFPRFIFIKWVLLTFSFSQKKKNRFLMTERNHIYKILTYSWLGFPASLFQPANLRLYLTQTWRFNISWNLQYHQFLYV